MNLVTKSALAFAISASALFAEPSGLRNLTLHAPHHGRDLKGVIHYPATASGTVEKYADNPVFVGMEVAKDAGIAEGQFPLVLLSHGLGGHARSLGWLATDLAQNGAIVIAVNHPNSTWGDFDLAAGLDHWTRPQDLSLALDHILADPDFSGKIDMSRIMAAGFSYGGWTALSLGGIRGHHAAYVDHCKTYGAASSHCADLLKNNVTLASAAAQEWDALYKDARVTAAFAVDPGIIWGMGAEQVADLTPEVTLVSLGAGENRLLATDFDLAKLPEALPHAEVISIPSAAHFSMMPICKPIGEALLLEEGDDPVCTDPEGADRAAAHQIVLKALHAKLGL
ncbi:alpha/beta hydrolase family protein [Sulfitobacter donghicola]|uniref:Lipoprotein signal peptide n=1 Tax=Sulfitobacter donghicola DSW-25 = KCTC 12864 = JCM 14565 TaxID=1300350 RepID=A0A073IJF3_9RHOB|nr:hypothetical protein [Sulfitobacter donghicola]KEJ89715.1 lipoprotein signal peptide [Sulfitobacter donghicola DSW-25 = KCTC 12864 = JCM 14565]KIN67191.1 Lipoprotein signal peptide [Sulfitobacter donghicola DSW-25 = KCTC 12864 = JCM 14565]